MSKDTPNSQPPAYDHHKGTSPLPSPPTKSDSSTPDTNTTHAPTAQPPLPLPLPPSPSPTRLLLRRLFGPTPPFCRGALTTRRLYSRPSYRTPPSMETMRCQHCGLYVSNSYPRSYTRGWADYTHLPMAFMFENHLHP